VRLKELHINNFKFFPKEDRKSPLLKIDGKNLLIYGENGSGKSTIYWALYTLLESSFKKRDSDVERYFVRGGPNGLVNIHSSKSHHAHIKAVLTDGTTTKDFLVSGDVPTIQAIRANSDVRESGILLTTEFSSAFIMPSTLMKMIYSPGLKMKSYHISALAQEALKTN
jgi:predicted ATPase